jgi:hypothetical protein
MHGRKKLLLGLPEGLKLWLVPAIASLCTTIYSASQCLMQAEG